MVKFLVDSASDITLKEAEERGVYLVSMSIRFGTEEYLDGVDLYPEDFYDKLVESTEFPKTSLINEFTWEEVFTKLTEDGSEVVAITISSKLSGTFDAAKNASEKFNGKVFVVDSMNACAGERLLLEYALLLREQGKTANQIKSELDQKKEKIRIMAMVNTLEYLRKGGRISSIVAVAGTMLSIKPVVAIEEGKVKLVGKAMGSKKANNLLNSLVEKCGGIDFTVPFYAIYSGKDDTILKKYIKDSAHLWSHAVEQVPVRIIGSTIGSHVGPGAVGVAFFEK